MNKNINKHREQVISALAELKSDTEHIKETMEKNEKWLNQINGRVRKTEEEVSFIKGIGSVVGVLFGASIGWLFRR